MKKYRVIRNDCRGFNNLSYTVCSRTDGSRNYQSFLLRCAVCSSYVFLRLERSSLRWRLTAARRHLVCLHFMNVNQLQLSSGNSASNSGKNHYLTIPFEGGMHSLKRQGACVKGKPSPLTCYKQFGTNWIIVLMFVESQRVHI